MHKFATFLLILGLFGKSFSQTNAEMNHLLDKWRVEMPVLGPQIIVQRCDSILSLEKEATARAAILTLRATASRKLGNIQQYIRDNERALRLRDASLGKNSEWTASSLMNIGNGYRLLGDNTKAAIFYTDSYAIYQKVYKDAPVELIKIRTNLGAFYTQIKAFDRAETLFQAALATPTVENNALLAPTAGLAEIFYQKGSYDSAAFYFQNAINLCKDKASRSQKVDYLINLANSYLQQGNSQQAYESLEAASKLQQQLADLSPIVLGNLNLAYGNVHFDRNNFQSAVFFYEKATNFYPNGSLLQSDGWVALARALRFQAKVEQASQVCMQSIPNIIEQSNGLDQKRLDIALLTLGDLYMDMEKYSAAAYYFGEIGGPNGNIKSDLGQKGLLKYVEALRQQGKISEASKEIRRIKPSNLTPSMQYVFWYTEGKIRASKDDYVGAVQAFDLAWSALAKNRTSFPYESLQIELAKTQIQVAQAQKSALKSDFEKSLYRIDALLDHINSYREPSLVLEAQLDFQRLFFSAYDLAVETAMHLHDDTKAFYYAEQSKQAFLRRLTDNMQKSDSQLDVEKKLVWFQQKRLKIIGNKAIYDKKAVAHLDEEIQQLRTALMNFEKTQPGFDVQLQDVQTNLGEDASFLSFYTSKKWFVGFCITRDTCLVKKIAIDAVFLSKIQTYYSFCRQHPSLLPMRKKEEECAHFAETSHFLYQKIVEPFSSQVRPNLTLVLDGYLQYVPFEALLDIPITENFHRFRNHPFLIKKHNFRYTYSAATAFQKNEKHTGTAGLFAFAPSFEGDSRGLNVLMNNIQEVQAIIGQWGGKSWESLAATERIFKDNCGEASVLLLSTHGKVDDLNPAYGFVAFTENKADSLSDNLLYASEIALLRLKANLVVLSACETADGRLARGEGLMSLASAFQLAGAKSVLASLWNVDDRQMPILMGHFFESLSKENKAKALQIACTKSMAEGTHEDAHPFFWASMRLMGADGSVTLSKSQPVWVWFFGGTVLLLLAWFLISSIQGIRGHQFKTRA